ncbi:unnamed protein product [Ixodes pacificus]
MTREHQRACCVTERFQVLDRGHVVRNTSCEEVTKAWTACKPHHLSARVPLRHKKKKTQRIRICEKSPQQLRPPLYCIGSP